MSHREEFVKALRAAILHDDFCDQGGSGYGCNCRTRELRTELLKLYDEKPPAPEDLEAVARSAAEEGYDTPKQGFVSFAAIAEQVVTGYLASRPLTETPKEKAVDAT